MKGDLPQPAVRLLASLPVTTHLKPEPLPKHTVYMRERRLHGKTSEHDGMPKPIRIGKHVYPSIAEARIKLRKASQTIYRMLEDGTAEFC